MELKRTLLVLSLSAIAFKGIAQKAAIIAEDTLAKTKTESTTTIGGYGNAFYQRNSSTKTANVNLERFVLFVGHKFNDKISFFSEVEVEDAKVSGGEHGGEVAIEQAYLKFNLNANQYITAGLFIPRIGILNENHLPNSFNGNERNYVETYILPSTWRELGVALYGNFNRLPLNYSIALVNGLNSSAFEHGSGIREGRYEGRNASANNLAITGALQYYQGNFKAQVSGYYGGTVGASKTDVDVLGLKAGTFGTPVAIGEADVQYSNNGWSARVLGTIVSIPDAFNINAAYHNNTPQTEYGVYAELGYDLLYTANKQNQKQLVVFVRDEKFNINSKIPSNGVVDAALNQNHVVAGFTYLPIRNVAIKGDVRFVSTAQQNSNYNLVNLGVALSF